MLLDDDLCAENVKIIHIHIIINSMENFFIISRRQLFKVFCRQHTQFSHNMKQLSLILNNLLKSFINTEQIVLDFNKETVQVSFSHIIESFPLELFTDLTRDAMMESVQRRKNQDHCQFRIKLN